MPTTANSPMLTRREAAAITGLSVGVLDKAIEQKIMTVYRRGTQSFLRSDDLAVVMLLQSTSLPLPMRRCLRPDANSTGADPARISTDGRPLEITPRAQPVPTNFTMPAELAP